MSEPGTPTFDQLRVFLTVVEMGSFAGAARKLGRATSVISYSIGNLEAQLGISLFDRDTTRKPQLTDAGRSGVRGAHGRPWDERVAREGEGAAPGARGGGASRPRRYAQHPRSGVIDALKAF